ncbi:hypothetical protein CGZ93_04530 [Enemella dayhoffiae]|uniref:Uncharacterized protein n=1 Tax=Enemella dayhoffiae TaxID=2016507 RepID=A0A255H908_9ACTN|nr:hypothetical protein [Enemella dayhoffiae]OYO24091.1 hypothetical protein CGZ93_04530 [Enemella dayhoffiae]
MTTPIAAYAAAIGWVAIRFPAGLPSSSDPGASSQPVWATVLPAAVALIVTRFLPLRPAWAPEPSTDRSRGWGLVIVLLMAELGFVLSAGLPKFNAEADYLLWKVLLPGALLWWVGRRRPSPSVDLGPRSGWLLVPVLGYLILTHVGPWATRMAAPGVDAVTLVLVAAVTALTA